MIEAGGLIMLFALMMPVGLVAAYVHNWLQKTHRPMWMQYALFAATLFLGIFIPLGHAFTSEALDIEKQQFVNAVETGDVEYSTYETIDRPVTLADYRGRLDAIVKARDAHLDQLGCVGVGSWVARDYRSPSLTMAYLCNPVQVLKLAFNDVTNKEVK